MNRGSFETTNYDNNVKAVVFHQDIARPHVSLVSQ